MKILSFIFLFFMVGFSFGQTRKAFIDKAGKYTADPQGATGYVLITKLDGDSAYLVKKFDMVDTIVFSGTYKDSTLAIPNGRFVYYNKNRLPKDKNTFLHMDFITAKDANVVVGFPIDTNNFVKEVGYYQNGKKEGLWVNYAERRVKASEIMYQNGKQNGQYKIYIGGSGGWTQGTMVNDELEGKLNEYNVDSILVKEMDMKHGRMINEIDHFHHAKENAEFDKYLENKLAKYRDLIIVNLAEVKYTVDNTGKIMNPQIVKGINPEFDNAVVLSLLSAPNYLPATYDGSPIVEIVNKPITLFDYYDNKNMEIRASAKRQSGSASLKQ